MRSRVRLGAGVALVVGCIIAGTAGIAIAGSHRDRTVIEAHTLFGVDPPFTGSVENAIRGVVGAGAPWVVDRADVKLRESGRLEVEVEGLVIGPNGPPAFVGINPVPTFKVTVSCVSIDANGAAITANVSTDPFPADRAGDAQVETTVALPSPCIAPIIFVASGAGGAWFAVTGV